MAESNLIVELAQNATLILAFAFIHSIIFSILKDLKDIYKEIITGMIFGIIAIIAMLFPIEIIYSSTKPGIPIDSRLVLVTFSGVLSGPISGLITSAIASIYRLNVGNPISAFSGIIGIFAAGLTGVLINLKIEGRIEDLQYRHYVLIGLGLRLEAILWVFLIPVSLESILTILQRTVLPNTLMYLIASLVIGFLMTVERERRELENLRAEFITITSHALRTPLTIIEGHTTFLKTHLSELDYRDQMRCLELIARNVDRLDDLVSRVSITSNIERGIIELNTSRVDFPTFMNESIESFYKIIDPGQLSYTPLTVEKDLNLKIDESRIFHVFNNIINNAITHTSPNARRISVTVKILSNFVEITFRDNGTGVSKENLNVIFDKYTSFPSKYAVKSTGLGLFISKSIIEKHGGSVSALSEGVDQGSQFIILLPKPKSSLQTK